MDYQELVNRLVELEEFDPAAFVGDECVSQELCDLFLAFALVYNDFRDVIFARKLLSAVEPADQAEVTPRRGLASGLHTALMRAQCGLVHELIELAIAKRSLIDDAFFTRVHGQLSRRGKQAWRAVRDVAAGRSSGDPLAKALAILRNKVAFHYDPEELGRGYRKAFVDEGTHDEPLLSRGNRLSETRFYFADAAAQVCLLSRTPTDAARAFILGKSEVLEALHFALFKLITRFVQTRGFGWRRPGV